MIVDQSFTFRREELFPLADKYADEFRTARTAAALNRFDPSLYFGEPRQLRLGIEVTF